MPEAAAKLRLHFNSFKKRAIELACYTPNQARIGIRKNMPKIPISEIIEDNLHPNYQTYKLKQRLLEGGVKKIAVKFVIFLNGMDYPSIWNYIISTVIERIIYWKIYR